MSNLLNTYMASRQLDRTRGYVPSVVDFPSRPRFARFRKFLERYVRRV